MSGADHSAIMLPDYQEVWLVASYHPNDPNMSYTRVSSTHRFYYIDKADIQYQIL